MTFGAGSAAWAWETLRERVLSNTIPSLDQRAIVLKGLICAKRGEADLNNPAKKQAAQPEPKQTEEDSIRALLGARIKEMEVILERLQAERERLANVASAEELDALEMEIRARQKLIHAINQGADDMELHLCVERIRAWEEERKECEQMRLSDA